MIFKVYLGILAAAAVVVAAVSTSVGAPPEATAAADSSGCHVVSPWAGNLEKRLGHLKSDHPTDFSLVCASSRVAEYSAGRRMPVADILAVYRRCETSAGASGDCAYVAAEYVDVIGRTAALQEYARTSRCAAPSLQDPC